MPATRLGLRPTGPGPFRVRAVVQLRRRPSSAGVEVERVPTVDGITELVAQSSYSRLLDRPLHRLAALAHDVGGIARVTYAEAGDLGPVLGRAAGEPVVSRARRLPIVDEYVEDGRAAVYAGNGDVVALSELATGAWAALTEDWTSMTELSAVLVAEFGEPEGIDAVAATEATLRALADHGLAELD